MWRIVAVGGVALGLVGCGPVAVERSIDIVGDFDRVRVELSNGDIEVRRAEADRVELDVDFGGVATPNGVGHFVEDGELVLDYGCPLCGGDIVLGMPDEMPVEVNLQHGEIELDGLTGPVNAEVNAGSVVGEDLACDTRVFNRSGSIELEWDFRPLDVDLEAHVGAIELEVPAGGYALNARSNAGVVRLIDVFDDPESENVLRAFAHAGEVEIEGQ